MTWDILRAGVLAIALSLMSGCALQALDTEREANPDESLVQALSTVAMKDAQAALVNAQVHNDKIGATCWQGVVSWLMERPQRERILDQSNTGGMNSIQNVRNLMMQSGSGTDIITPELRIACAAMVNDGRRTAIKLAAIFAAASKGVPASTLMGLMR